MKYEGTQAPFTGLISFCHGTSHDWDSCFLVRIIFAMIIFSYWLHVFILTLGAYGAAVLYRKKDDDSLVILKEISLHDLTATERQMAMNEVCLCNCCSYYIKLIQLLVIQTLDHLNLTLTWKMFHYKKIILLIFHEIAAKVLYIYCS